ncbi:30112_t:CDS:2, partial [Gigaspora margarita]
ELDMNLLVKHFIDYEILYPVLWLLQRFIAQMKYNPLVWASSDPLKWFATTNNRAYYEKPLGFNKVYGSDRDYFIIDEYEALQ